MIDSPHQKAPRLVILGNAGAPSYVVSVERVRAVRCRVYLGGASGGPRYQSTLAHDGGTTPLGPHPRTFTSRDNFICDKYTGIE
ncbi:unnamed protein product, partial [Brenthis ino]